MNLLLLRRCTSVTALLAGCGCSDLGPVSGPLSGTWHGPMGVDTSEELVLEEHGSVVVGTFAFFGPVPVPPSRLTGRASLPGLTLDWRTSDGRSASAQLVLSPDGQVLTGTISYSGSRPTAFGPFRRAN